MDCCTWGHLLSGEMIQFGGEGSLMRTNNAANCSIQDNVVLHSTRPEPSLCDSISWFE
jgi:hypothetical protein